MQLYKWLTVSPLRSARLAMNQSTMKAKSRHLQRACKTRWLPSLGVRFWLFGPHWSHCQKIIMMHCAMFYCDFWKQKNSTWCFPFVNTATSITEQNWTKFFRWGVVTLHRWKLPQNCATISSLMPLLNPSLKLLATCEKFDSKLGELRMPDGLADSCVSSGIAFWKGTERLANWSSPYTQ